MAVDKLVDSTQLNTDLTSVANAIRAKSGGSSQLAFPNGFVSEIGNISTGEPEEPELKDVVFVDYDGTVLHNYTAQEFLALSAMPSNPSHTGLTAQGWNWSYADARAYVQANGMLVVGQNYTTSDGKTRLYLHLQEHAVGLPLILYLRATVKNSLTVSWGDGSTSTGGSANTDVRYTHTYNAAGDYVITIEATSGTYILGGTGSGKAFVYDKNAIASMFTKVEIGNSVTGSATNSTCFSDLQSLKSVSIPTTFLNIGQNFVSKTQVKCIVLPPSSVQTNGTYLAGQNPYIRFISFPKVFDTYSLANDSLFGLQMITFPERSGTPNARSLYMAQSLKKVCAPGTYTSIPQNFLRECISVKKFTVPASVTSIANYALHPMKSICEYHFKPTSPPTLSASTNMFTPNTWMKIYVPYSADHSVLEAYKTATNWATYADYIVEEPQ